MCIWILSTHNLIDKTNKDDHWIRISSPSMELDFPLPSVILPCSLMLGSDSLIFESWILNVTWETCGKLHSLCCATAPPHHRPYRCVFTASCQPTPNTSQLCKLHKTSGCCTGCCLLPGNRLWHTDVSLHCRSVRLRSVSVWWRPQERHLAGVWKDAGLLHATQWGKCIKFNPALDE